MKCGFCGREFDFSEGGVNCPGCPLRGNCGHVRCPGCGFDNPREATLVRLIRSWRNQWRGVVRPATTYGVVAETWPADHPTSQEREHKELAQRDGHNVALSEQGRAEAERLDQCRPLSELMPGEGGYVARIQSHDQRAFRKLMAMGILPGNPIKLLRRSPAYVFQVEYSQFAVDRDIAEKIYVR
ncbi:MAG: FeoA family protein [Anaerolineae bacterium]